MSSPDRIKSLVRWRAGLAIAAVVLPMALFALFERQARRLDALGAEGSTRVVCARWGSSRSRSQAAGLRNEIEHNKRYAFFEREWGTGAARVRSNLNAQCS